MKLAIITVLVFTACGGAKSPSSSSSSSPKTPIASGGTVEIEWVATQAANEMVDVSLVVAGTKIAIGQLNAASDNAHGTPATCSVMEKGFKCGQTPGYNLFSTELKGGELIVALHTGQDTGEALTDDVAKEVKRIPAKGDRLTVKPFSPKT